MLTIFFLISFNYNILRVMKDTLVVTGDASGPEAIPFIKMWVMFPGAVLMTYLFTKLSNRFSREAVFYIMLSLFLGFFTIFTFVLYPYREVLHLNAFADSLQTTLPGGCGGLIAMVRNWSFTLFYAMSELWGNIVLFVLFWGLANEAICLNQAKRFYGVLGVGANFSGVFAGLLSYWLSGHVFNPRLPFGTEAWEQTQYMLIGLVLISGVVTMGILRWMYRTQEVHSEEPPAAPDVDHKLGFLESISYVWRSKYLLCIGVIVVVYNIVINLTEVLWKHQVKELYSAPNEYSQYMNLVTALIGVIATLSSLLLSSNGIRIRGWTWTALVTPVILLIGSILFFGSYFVKEYVYMGSAALLPLVAFLGSFQNILSRGAKYSVFDATKEVAFIPLGDECKLKGKAAIDGIGSRFGKSGGAALQQGLFILFGGIAASAPFIAFLLFAMIGVWVTAVQSLGRQFNALTHSEPEASRAQTEPETQTV